MSRRLLMASSAVLALGLVAPATAQESANVIAEVVVTAEKREESLQDVPVAVTAFTSEQRDLVGITTVQDITNFTPGLQYSTQIDRTSLRGIGRLTNVQSAEGGVAIYSDQVYTTSTVEAGKSPLFVERVEVLRGPQGTLYGRNSISGAINVISRRPTEDWYAEVRGTVANYDRTLLEAAVSGPTFFDWMQFRVVGNWEKQQEGWIDNVVPGQPDEGNVIDTKILEGQLQFQFTDDFEGWMKLTTFDWDNGAGGPGARATWTPSPYPRYLFDETINLNEGFGLNPGTGGVNASPLGAVNPAIDDPRKIASTTPYDVKLEDTYVFASEWIYDLDFAALKYITGGTRYHYTLTGPTNPDAAPITQFTYGGLPINPQYTFQYEEFLSWWSHEFNLASTNDSNFQWLVGAYHFREHYRQPVSSGYPFEPKAQFSLVLPTFAPGAPNPRGHIFDSRPSLKITSKALYGQVDWNFAPSWKTTLGLRYSEDEKSGQESIRLLTYLANTFTGAFNLDLTRDPATVDQNPPNPIPEGVAGPSTFDPATGFLSRPYDASWSATTGTAGIQWEPDVDTNVYARYSRGYKAGGFRLGINVVPGPQPLTDKEEADAFEVGLKKTFFDDRFQLNTAAFYYDYRNAQIPLNIPASQGSSLGADVLFNVPEAFSRGIEIETITQPIDGLQILFNYSFLNAEVTEGQAVDPADPTALDPEASPGEVTNRPDNFLPGAGGACINSAVGGPAQCQVRQDLDGERLPNTPRHKLAINTNYTRNWGPVDVIGSISYTWRSSQYGSIFTRDYYRAKSNGQLDARVTFASTDDKYSLIIFGRNLTDEIVYEGGAFAERRAGRSGTGGFVVEGIASTYFLAAPRTFGIELQYRFF